MQMLGECSLSFGIYLFFFLVFISITPESGTNSFESLSIHFLLSLKCLQWECVCRGESPVCALKAGLYGESACL